MQFSASALLMIPSSVFIQEDNVTVYTFLRSGGYGTVKNKVISFIMFTSITFEKPKKNLLGFKHTDNVNSHALLLDG